MQNAHNIQHRRIPNITIHTRKVLYVDSGIAVSLSLTPEQQRILGRFFLAALVLLVDVDLDLLDLEAQDYRPYQTED